MFVFVSFFQVYIRQHKKDHSQLTTTRKEAPSPSNVEEMTNLDNEAEEEETPL
jgi:hypothetical protein